MGCGASTDERAKHTQRNTLAAPHTQHAHAQQLENQQTTATAATVAAAAAPGRLDSTHTEGTPAAASADTVSAALGSASRAVVSSTLSLSLPLHHCLTLLDAVLTRRQWLAEFRSYLGRVQSDMDAASSTGLFARPDYTQQLAAQLASSERIVASIVGRPSWLAAIKSGDDRASLQAQMVACEKIKSEALHAMLTEIKADSSAALAVAESIRAHLSEVDQRAAHDQRDRAAQQEARALMARLQPLEFTADVAAELRAFMPGTRQSILQAVDQWLNLKPTASSAAAAKPTPSNDATDAAAASAAAASSSTSAAAAAAAPVPAVISSSSRLFWIRGGPGTGKSCVSAKLLDLHSASILAFHLCRHDSADRRDAKRLVKSLAHQLAQRLPPYASKLQDIVPAIFGGDSSGQSSSNKSAVDLWQQLIVDPLAAVNEEVAELCAQSGRKLAILIDALDESASAASNGGGGGGGGKNELLDLLSTGCDKLPPWLGLIITSRPEALIVAKLSRSTPLQMDCESAENQRDLRAFFEHCLSAAMGEEQGAAGDASSAPSSPPSSHAAVVDQLLSKSAGLFLLGRLMMEQHGLLPLAEGAAEGSDRVRDYRADPLSVAEVAQWPAGLDAFYLTCMQRVRGSIVAAGGKGAMLVDHDGHSLPADLSALLRALAFILCAAEPLTLACVAEMMNLENRQGRPDFAAAFRMLAPVRSLLPVSNDAPDSATSSSAAALPSAASSLCSPLSTVVVYHKSVRDWFTSPARRAGDDGAMLDASEDASVYAIDEQDTHAKMAGACWRRLVDTDAEPPVAAPHASVAASSSSSNAAASALVLPALCVDELYESLPTDPALLASEFAGLPPSFLRYAVSSGPTHALACGDAAATSAASSFLCHPQYLHLRASLGQTQQLSEEFVKANEAAQTEAAAEAAAKSKTSKVKKKRSVASNGAADAPSEWRWSLALPSQLDALSLFLRLYLRHAQHWRSTPQLVYQYACSFPDSTVVCQLAQRCLPWFQSWSGRAHTIASLLTKDDRLSELINTIDCVAGERRTASKVVCFALHPTRPMIATGHAFDRLSPTLKLFHPAVGVQLRALSPISLGQVVSKLQFSPDGRYLAAGVSRGNQERVGLLIFDAENLTRLYDFRTGARSLDCIAWSSDSQRVLRKCWDDAHVAVFSMQSGSMTHKLATNSRSKRAMFSRTDPDLIVLLPGNMAPLTVWSLSRSECISSIAMDTGHTAVLSADSRLLATCAEKVAEKRDLRLFRAEDGTRLPAPPIEEVCGMDFSSPNASGASEWLAVSTVARHIYIVCLRDGRIVYEFVAREAQDCLLWTADNTRLFSRGVGGTKLFCFDTSMIHDALPSIEFDPAKIALEVAEDDSAEPFVICPAEDPQWLLTAPRLAVLDCNKARMRAEHGCDPSAGSVSAIVQHGDSIAIATDVLLQVRSFSTLRLQCEYRGHVGSLMCVDWSRDGQWLASGAMWRQGGKNSPVDPAPLRIWRVKATERDQPPPIVSQAQWLLCGGDERKIDIVRFSADSQRLAAVDISQTVRIFMVADGSLAASFRVGAPVKTLEWISDDQHLLIASLTLQGFGALQLFHAMSGESRTLMSSHRVPNDFTSERLIPLYGHKVQQARLSPNGSLLLTRGASPFIQIWRMPRSPGSVEPASASGASALSLVHTVRLHHEGCSAKWSSDGRCILVLTMDSAIRVHQLPEWLAREAAEKSSPTSAPSPSLSPRLLLSDASGFDEPQLHRVSYC